MAPYTLPKPLYEDLLSLSEPYPASGDDAAPSTIFSASANLTADASVLDTPPNIITLDVGGRKFKTRVSTLTSTSRFFSAFFSGRWSSALQSDGSYFVDADPDVFKHLLSFMRYPGNFPMFWSRANGFDYAKYSRLGHQAEFFQIDALSDWIRD
jgi:hypothetical protein